MSIERCQKCTDTIDTDTDLDCYVTVNKSGKHKTTIPMCERCRTTFCEEIDGVN